MVIYHVTEYRRILLKFILFSLIVVDQARGNPAGFGKSVSRSSSPTHADEEAFMENELHSDFNRATHGKRIVEYSRHPIHSIHPEKQFPDVKVQSGKEDHHVASFYLNKPVANPTAQSTSPWSIGHREFHMPINNNKDAHDAFRDTANHLHSLGYRYQNKMTNTFAGKNPLAKQNEPSLYFTSHGIRAEGQLLSVLMRDRTPSPKRPSGGQTSSSAGHSGRNSPK